MSRFVLELTPLNKSIKNSKILMLGVWCGSIKERNETTIDYHWDDRSKLYNDYEYIFSLYEKYLNKLSKGLNEIHGTNHTIEFWRIIVGPWLHYFISIVLDRYEMLNIAAQIYEIKHTRIPNYNSADYISETIDSIINQSLTVNNYSEESLSAYNQLKTEEEKKEYSKLQIENSLYSI